MATGESATHRRLKEQAFLWAYDRGFRCCAMEVRAPRSSYRVDVAGFRSDRNEQESIVAVFECKQSREDLFRDNRRQSELKSNLLALQDRRQKLESLLAVHYPSLRTSDSLFPEWATFDFTTIDHRAYNQTIQKIVRIQRQLLENTKFDLITRYGLGNLHYLTTTPGLLDNREVPIGWGLIEVHGNEQIVEKLVPTRFKGVETLQWLDRIAKAATAERRRSYVASAYLEVGMEKRGRAHERQPGFADSIFNAPYLSKQSLREAPPARRAQ